MVYFCSCDICWTMSFTPFSVEDDHEIIMHDKEYEIKLLEITRLSTHMIPSKFEDVLNKKGILGKEVADITSMTKKLRKMKYEGLIFLNYFY